MKYNIISLCLLIAVLTSFYGCESTGGPGGGTGTEYDYTLNGFFVQDVNTSVQKPNYNDFVATMTKNALGFGSAQLFFGTSAIAFNSTDSIYSYSTSPRLYKTPGATSVIITDSPVFSGTVISAILDSLWITNDPDLTGPNTNGTSTPLEWSAVSGITGYIIAVVLEDDAYSGAGYSAYVTDLTPSTSIPPDAYRANPTSTLDTGWYNIYVYAYVGAPDLALSDEILPVPFPTQLPNNIAQTDLTGHFGSIVVSRLKRLHVVSQ